MGDLREPDPQASHLQPAGRHCPGSSAPPGKGSGERQTLAKKLAKVPQNGQGKASQIAARIAKTNSTYVEAVKSISKNAPDLVEKIRAVI